MHHADLTDYVQFSEDGPERHTVFESERLWSQVIALGRNQTYGPVGDSEADAMLTVVVGEVVFIVDKKRKRMAQWGAVLVPAGAELIITNASADPSVILVVTAPPPAANPAAG